MGSPPIALASAAALQLTPEEQAFLAAHPKIRVQNEMDWPPFNFNENNQPLGISIDLMNLLAERLGIQVEYLSGPSWAEFLAMMKTGELDAILNIVITPDRLKFIDYTPAYAKNPSAIVSRLDSGLASMEDLKGKRVAFPKGFSYEELVASHYPEVEQVLVKNQLDSLKAVAMGQADAALGEQAAVDYLMREHLLTGLQVSGEAKLGDQEIYNLRIGVRKDIPLLRDLLEKAMATVSAEEMAAIRNRWWAESKQEKPTLKAGGTALDLTPEERRFLQGKGRITYCIDPDWMPYEAIEEGRHVGMSAEFLGLFARRLGLPFELVPTRDWRDTLQSAESRRCDILSAVMETPERLAHWTFTTPYMNFPLVIATRTSELFVEDLNTLKDRPVGVVAGYAVERILSDHYPGVQRVPVANLREGLEQVQEGKLFGMVDLVASIGYLIQKQHLLDLKIAGKLDHTFPLGLGVRNDEPLLHSVLEKAVQSVDAAERAAIQGRWLSVRYEQGFDYALLWKVLAGALLILLAFLAWNRKLAQLNRRVNAANVEIREAQRETAAALDQVATLLDNSGEGFLSFGPDLRVRSGYSRECEKLFGGPVAGQPAPSLLLPLDPIRAATLERNLRMLLESRDEFRREMLLGLLPAEVQLGERVVRIRYRPLGEAALMLILADITQEKRLEERIREERERLRFVVTVVRNRDEFFDLVEECRRFHDEEFEAILAADRPIAQRHAEIYRRIHTYKGLFSQLDFIALPHRLHAMEDGLARLKEAPGFDAEAIRRVRREAMCDQGLARDLEILRRFLGEGFFADRRRYPLDDAGLAALEGLAARIEAAGLADDPAMAAALALIRRLRLADFRALIEGYPKYTLQLAQRLGKEIRPFQIEGEAVEVNPERFGRFAKSLIHLFRNAVEHGIETPDERLDANKDEHGTITCRVERREGELLFHFTDDGRGLPIEQLRRAAAEKGIVAEAELARLTDAEIRGLIFADGLSSRDSVSDLSGRGEGLAAVKAETERIGGRIRIESPPTGGTHFYFALPMTGN